MSFSKWMTAAYCGALAVMVATGVSADENHYINMLIGDRSTGMGGAYTAVSDDATGMYYNPAGIVYSTGRSLSASVNTYYFETKKYDNVLGGQGWERKSESLLPNFFGVLQPVGRWKVGFSYAVPDSIRENQDQTFYNLPTKFPGIQATSYTINFFNEDNTYLFGPTAAFEIRQDLAVGMTLYYHQRINKMVQNQLIVLDNGKYELTNINSNFHENGLRPTLGVMWAPWEQVTVGATISKVFILHSSISNQLIYKDSNYDGNTVDFTVSTSADKREYPLQVQLGVGWFPSRALLVSFDAKYSEKVTGNETFGDRVSVWNAALGAEYYLDKNWAIRGGLFSDLSNRPDIQSGKIDQVESVDLYGTSFSISHFTRNTSVTLGTVLTKGSGNAQVLSGSTQIQNVDVFGWSINLSTSYNY